MANNSRINKINEEVKRELTSVLREVKDKRIPPMTTVVAVNVTNDFRYAKVYISVIGLGNADTKKLGEEAIKGLRSAAGFIRKEIGNRVKLRYTPEFIFELDHSIEHGAHINQIIHDLK